MTSSAGKPGRIADGDGVVELADLAVIGAGAAGLMAGIWAGRIASRRRIVILDSARRVGAKILVSGGGRCNVTHASVDERAFAGSTRPAIRKVLRRFDVERTIAFFRELGVALEVEETGKLFPVTDRARTVLDALLGAAREAGAVLRHPCRVESIVPVDGGFLIQGPRDGPAAWDGMRARQVVLATGGRSLPRSGSDGHGYAIARSLGHSLTPRILPGLVPLELAAGSFVRQLSGVSTRATLSVRLASGAVPVSFTGPVLCTHFGLSGPAALDISRYYLDAATGEPQGSVSLVVNWLPEETRESADDSLRRLGGSTPLRMLRSRLPERLARALCEAAGIDPLAPGGRLTRQARAALAAALTAMTLPVTGHRGFDRAEVTAGGVPLEEVHLDTMRSRRCPGLALCGEILDVDGRIGGFNFQWAWASGHVAGCSAWLERPTS